MPSPACAVPSPAYKAQFDATQSDLQIVRNSADGVTEMLDRNAQVKLDPGVTVWFNTSTGAWQTTDPNPV